MPVIPINKPEIMVIIKISKGCEFTEVAKIRGCETLFYMACTIIKPTITPIVFGKISL